jgi:hypothetical protein
LVITEELEPGGDVGEGLGASRIVDEDGSVCVAEVGGDQRFVLFLTGRVPELESVGSVLEC